MKSFCSKALTAIALSAALISCSNGNGNVAEYGTGNPYLPLWEHLPDGEPRVFEDPDNPGKYRIYIIGSHDVSFTQYCGADIRQWSAPVEDLSDWRDEGAIFTYRIDGQSDIMFAPDLVEIRKKDGSKEYVLYPHSRGPRREPLVAKGNRPDGPFTPVNLSEDGKGVLEGSIMGFDPSVFVQYVTDPSDPDYEIGFRAYGFWGFQQSNAAELDQNTMYSVRPGTEVNRNFIPAAFRYGLVRDKEGTEYKALFPGEDIKQFNFFEASSIRQIGNKYVWVFSGHSGPDYGIGSSNSTLRYAYGDSPLGPWKIGGVLVDSRAPVLNEDGSHVVTSYSGHNTHGSLEQMNGQWYVFYHRAPRGFGYARQAVVAPVKVVVDETPVADGGKVSITGFDPYAADQSWTAKASDGFEYKGAEVTSEGFHVFGLDPYKYYSAGYACYLSDISLQTDTWDIWDNSMPLAGVKSGDIIGYKYFGFGGLDEAKLGLKPFAGTAKGNKTNLDVFLAPVTDAAFTLEVWMDGPFPGSTWNGKKIAEIAVPAGASKEVARYSADVADAVDGIGGKHAIYFIAKGGDGQLCNIEGLGFSKNGKSMVRPVAPKVNITVDGQAVEMPATPVRFTHENGLLGYDHYELDVEANGKMPKIKATADGNVKIKITPAESIPGDAIVSCNYKGVEKIYTIHIK